MEEEDCMSEMTMKNYHAETPPLSPLIVETDLALLCGVGLADLLD